MRLINLMKLTNQKTRIGKQTHGKRIEILTNKQMAERLSPTFAQVKAGNTSENLLNKVGQII